MAKDMFSKMFNGQKLMDRFFKKVDGVVWDIMTGNVGIATDDGVASLNIDADGNAQVVINMFEQFGIPIPAFAQNTPFEAIKVGDLIITEKRRGWVVEIKNKTLVLLRTDGSRGEWSPPKTISFGLDLNGAMVLRNLTNMFGDPTKFENMKSNMLPLLMMMKGEGDMSRMIPMMLMMNTTGTAANNMTGGMNPMMLMMMMNSKNNDGDEDDSNVNSNSGRPIRKDWFNG